MKQRKVSFDVEPWSNRRNSILTRFTTSEKLSIVTSFLSDGEKVVVKTQSVPVDKVQHRLEQLDYFEEGSQKKFNLSQTEYVNRIEQLNRELVKAWNSEQRVKALKIAIQCAKVLADSDVLIFYPSKYVLITDILDIFGQLVYERLRTKADYYKYELLFIIKIMNFSERLIFFVDLEVKLQLHYQKILLRTWYPSLQKKRAGIGFIKLHPSENWFHDSMSKWRF